MRIMGEMQKPVVRWRLGLAAAVAVLGTGVLSVGAQAPASGTGGPREGITVHGHWTIDVRQPDGALVTRREFENELQATGANLIADLLARRKVQGTWSIFVASNDPADGPCRLGSTGFDIKEDGWGYNPTDFETLVVDPTGLTLHGTATATRNGLIEYAGTGFTACNATNLVSACATFATGPSLVTGGGQFSSATVTPPISVVPNQLIQVSVSYTFSAGGTTVVR
jgi:hypothetical protein